MLKGHENIMKKVKNCPLNIWRKPNLHTEWNMRCKRYKNQLP